MNRIVTMNFRRQELMRKQAAGSLTGDEIIELASIREVLLDFIDTRDPSPRNIAAIDQLMNGPTSICMKCGGQFGHPGPCPQCVPRYGLSVQRAWDFASKAHNLEFRKGASRLPYMVHIAGVMRILGDWGFSVDEHYWVFELAALHDVVENHGATLAEIRREFGDIIANGVDELTIPEDTSRPAHEVKRAYKASFGGKSILSLVVKVADQIYNIGDFAVTNPRYAPKYLAKCEPIFDAALQRTGEIRDKFGKEIVDNMVISIMAIRRIGRPTPND